jgi:hypothetical protein
MMPARREDAPDLRPVYLQIAAHEAMRRGIEVQGIG